MLVARFHPPLRRLYEAWLDDWAELDGDWTSVPPINRPVPNPMRYPTLSPSLQSPCQTKKKSKLLVFNKYQPDHQ
jgi:hypothetical protein